MVFGNGLGVHVDLADGHNRLAAGAVEHIHIALFGGHGQCGLYALGGGDVEQRRLRRGVHIPEIMMHELLHPARLSGLQVQRHHR